ncbi:hypothetical protein HGP28_09280 [Vibrio sp. SM6]|uniref:Lipoprotein n=1 Tax=Vibrio agarilyticus TaxID=2726741 RepID=A0A7X8TQU8_9VIBR|nr:hypothetical protein [Vibrio agarilyticus]NLS13080.1 hypothetical protein [Vibrio agarilyticus]
MMNAIRFASHRAVVIRFLFAVFMSSAVGCAEHISERQGPTFDVIPISYGYQLTIKHESQAWEQLLDYVDQHWQTITQEPVTIVWTSVKGKKMAQRLKQHLQKAGVSAEQVVLSGSQQATQHFDLGLSMTAHHVLSPLCPYASIGEYGAIEGGCAPESGRWQSMVHPEKMLVNPNWAE